jgi:hypothetical protein
VPRVHPAIKQFRAHAATEFQFLVEDFGFKQERGPWKYNDFSVRFVNATTRVVVEARNYGFNARVAFGSAGPKDQFENCDLLDFVAIRCPGEGPNAEELTHGQLRNTGALAQLGAFAAILRRCGVGVLRGDLSVVAEIQEIQRRRREEWTVTAVPTLEAQLVDPSPLVRVGACWCLTRLGRGRECIPALIEALDESETDVRALAVAALADAGTGASEAIPALEARLRDEDNAIIRKQVEKALTSLRGGAESRGL